VLLEKSLDRTVTIGLLLVLGVIPNPSAQFERITNVVQIFKIFLLLISFCWLFKSAFLSVYASVKKAYRDYKKIK